jgi:N6-L-threonylcarbamoyladenine synthase
MLVLGIETSCDETAAAVVDVPARRILSNVLYSQYKEHAAYGGVVPELASRAHLERLPALITQALAEARLQYAGLSAIAATTGPGLTTALLMGATFGKTLALSLGKPFLPTNHIEGHALSPHLTDPTLGFPYLLLLVSGGHTQLVMVRGVGRYETLGTTADDAAGEGFDKVGKLLGLPHPAGPAIEALAGDGNPAAIPLPLPKNDKSLDFSFSGLKTAVRDLLANHPGVNRADLAASFQSTVAHILARKVGKALEHTGAQVLVAAGGVAANQAVRAALAETCAKNGARFSAPPPSLCTDNAAMIAYAAGLRLLKEGQNPLTQTLPYGNLATSTRPRWPLDEMSS